jgi:ABC-type nitrate/sulfonate/bicarbonate transport system ATPase subunit
MLNRAAKKISMRNVSHRYAVATGERLVLESVSFEVMTNDVVGIIGPTGVGKSTLLRLIAGFEQATSGQVVLWSGAQPKNASPSSNIGYLFQRPALFPWQTVQDNVCFGAKHSHTYKDEETLNAKVSDFLHRVGLTDARNLFPYQISGGMQARAALARVLLTRPEILLMDEPFGALDALTRLDMLALMREVIASSTELTTVLITHDVDEAIMLCNKILVLTGSPGRISAVFTSDVGQRPESVVDLQRESDYVSLRATLLESLGQRNSGPARHSTTLHSTATMKGTRC